MENHMEFSLDQYPSNVQRDLTAIAETALRAGNVLCDLSDDRSAVEIVSSLPGDPFATARGEMVLRIVTHHQEEEV